MKAINGNRLSDDLFDSIEEMKWDYVNGIKTPRGTSATPWIHLADAVERGSISPLEAYDAIGLEYLPEHLTIRESAYSHLLK